MNAAADIADIDARSSPAGAASYLYGLLGECFGYPDEELANSIRSGRIVLARLLAWDITQLEKRHGKVSVKPAGQRSFDGT